MTDQQQNVLSTTVNNIKSYLLDSGEVKRSFAENEIQKIFLENQDLKQRDIISYLHLAQLTGANPALKQIYLVAHFDKKKGYRVGTPIFSYHFLLAKAKETGKYKGVSVKTSVEDVFNPITGDMKKELVSTATIEVDGFISEFKAHWSEFFNPVNHIWKSKPYIMLEKCAIANVLKRAFPEALNGMVTEVEYNNKEIIEVENLADTSIDILENESEPISIEIKPHEATPLEKEIKEKEEVTQKNRKEIRNANKKTEFTLEKK